MIRGDAACLWVPFLFPALPGESLLWRSLRLCLTARALAESQTPDGRNQVSVLRAILEPAGRSGSLRLEVKCVLVIALGGLGGGVRLSQVSV